MTEKARVFGGKCDLCTKRLDMGEMVYTYVTPSTTTLEGAQQGLGFWAEDPRWGLCEWCHDLTVMMDAKVLPERDWLLKIGDRCLENNRLVVLGFEGRDTAEENAMNAAHRKHVVETLLAFSRNRTVGFTAEVNEGVPDRGATDHG